MNTRTSLFALAALAVTTAADTAGATTINSFTTGAVFNGIHITPLVSPNLSYTVTLDAGATFTLNNTTYNITDIIGFYLLAPGFNDGSQVNLAAVGGFTRDSDHRSAGSIYGWKSNPNNGITAGNSQTFNYPSINFGEYEMIGLHVRLDGNFPGTSGNTGNITGSFVPTPGAAAVLGLGGIASLRRRRR